MIILFNARHDGRVGISIGAHLIDFYRTFSAAYLFSKVALNFSIRISSVLCFLPMLKMYMKRMIQVELNAEKRYIEPSIVFSFQFF
jgi:hypothetical protein